MHNSVLKDYVMKTVACNKEPSFQSGINAVAMCVLYKVQHSLHFFARCYYMAELLSRDAAIFKGNELLQKLLSRSYSIKRSIFP